jgi:hypothetical protein
MKHETLLRKAALALVVLGVILYTACMEPVPLYGKWADNRGDSISFFDDSSFVATIVYPEDGTKKVYEGSWSILLNSLTLTCTNADLQIVSEWDIRGNMLYLEWASDTGSLPLTLYKISD